MFDAFGRIVREEGIKSCWNGAAPTICRAMSLNVAMLVTYDTVKEKLQAYLGKGANQKAILFAASMVSACATSTASLPFDNLKTKL